jgi:hypothetical protein
MNHFYQMISGAMMMLSWVSALFFLRFWTKTHDRLFAAFALAFGFMGLERLLLCLWDTPNEAHISVYLIRLSAFSLIILAIVDKNRGAVSERA